MKNEFDSRLLESGAYVKRGYSAIVQNIGKSIAVITAVIAVLITFTEVGFCDISAQDFTTTLLVILISSYVIYFSLENAGESLGKEQTEYKDALSEYTLVVSRVSADMVEDLRAYCSEYVKQELEYRKTNYLFAHGYFYSENKDSKRMRRIVERASNLKPIDITPRILLSMRSSMKSEEISNPETKKFLSLAIRLIPTTLCMLLTVSVILTTKDNMTLSDVLEGIIKLSTLPVVALKGYCAGYNYVTESLVYWTQTKTKLLRAFLDSREIHT